MPTEARKLIASFGAVAQALLNLAAKDLNETDLLSGMAKAILDFAQGDSADIFLLEHGRYRHFHAQKTGALSLIRSAATASDETVLPRSQDVRACDPDAYDDFCCAMLAGRIECEAGDLLRTQGFWTSRADCARQMIDRHGDARSRFRFCSSTAYPSLAVLPFDLDQPNRGLVVLKSHHEGFFTADTFELLQGAVNLLGMPIVHHRTQVALRERIKELTCLHEIARLAGATNIALHETLDSVAELLPSAWLHPEHTFARIVLDDSEFRSRGYRDGCDKLRANITVGSRCRGFVEVTYAGEVQSTAAGPFLDEERHLIELVARELSWIVEQSIADEHQRKLQEQLLHADRLATIGQLSAGVAHELNEPLGGILGFAQLSQKVPDVPEQVQRDLQRIVTASLHAREVIRKLLLFARQSGAKKGWIDLNTLVADGLYFLESRCAKAGVELIRELAADLPEIQGEPGQIYQVVINLAVNAIQAMPDGGRLTIATATSTDGVRITVEDTGIGMSDEVRRNIFLPFFTTKDIGEGTGLGLSVVQGIVAGHGGSISVESTQGVGTAFSVSLPMKSADSERPVER